MARKQSAAQGHAHQGKNLEGRTYAEDNAIYQAKMFDLIQAGFERFQVLGTVADEARFADEDSMGTFMSALVDCDIDVCSHGVELVGGAMAPMLMPELGVDLSNKSINFRIADAVNSTGAQQRFTKKPKKPHADPLVTTRHVIEAQHRTVGMCLNGGIQVFAPKLRCQPLPCKGAYHQDTNGRWFWRLDKQAYENLPLEIQALFARVQWLVSSDLKTNHRLWVDVSDSGSPLFRANITEVVEIGLRKWWRADQNHLDSNINVNLVKQSGMSPSVEKGKYAARFQTGPYRRHAGGKWKTMQREAFNMIFDDIQSDTTDSTPMGKLFNDSLTLMALEIGIDPSATTAREQVLTNLRKLSGTKGKHHGADAKWYGSAVATRAVLETRFRRQFLVEISLLLMNFNPWNDLSIDDVHCTKEQLFQRYEQGVVVMAAVLKSDETFQVLRMYQDIINGSRLGSGLRIMHDRNGSSSVETSILFSVAYSQGRCATLS